MKIARVFIQEYPGRQIGDVHDVFSPENHPGPVLSGIIAEVEVADDFDKDVVDVVVAEDKSVTIEPNATKAAAKVAAAALKEKELEITDRYNDMNADVYAQMAVVFGTNRSDSAQAYNETWKLMKEKPVLFYEKGLKAHKAVAGFAAGASLDTIQKIEDYADACLAEVEAYGVWRMERIKQFQDERAAILAG